MRMILEHLGLEGLRGISHNGDKEAYDEEGVVEYGNEDEEARE